jgi:hypothetical protein
MARRKEPTRKRKSALRTLLLVIIVCSLGLAAYTLKDSLHRYVRGEQRADITTLEQAMDSAYAAIAPRKISTSVVTLDELEVRHDRLELSRDGSLFKANLEITRAIEKAGGEVLFGIESSDTRRRWQAVTMGVSDGDSLVREIRLEKRIR